MRRPPLSSRRGEAGFTLIEMSLTIGIAALVLLFVAEQMILRWHLDEEDDQMAGVVRDVWGLADVVTLWASDNGNVWPNKTGVISIDQLVTDGLLRSIPPTRYAKDCGSSCDRWEYRLMGWDRDGSPRETTNAQKADDLLIRFRVAGSRRRADAIAARIPLGHVQSAGADQYDIEARLFRGGAMAGATAFVRLRGQANPVEFATGDIQGLDKVVRSMQRGDGSDHAFTGLGWDTQRLTVGAYGAETDSSHAAVRFGTDTDPRKTHVSWHLKSAADGQPAHQLALSVVQPGGVQGPALRATQHGTSSEQAGYTPFQFYYRPEQRSGGELNLVEKPAIWDAKFSDREGHASLHDRLCRLEGVLIKAKEDLKNDSKYKGSYDQIVSDPLCR